MTPSARLQAAIEILDLIILAARENGPAADTILASWFKTRRFAGSKDRRAVREHVYAAIRAFGVMPRTGREAFVGLARTDADLAALFDGTPYGPAVIAAEERYAKPSPLAPWLAALVPSEEHDALLERAPLDLRVNALKGTQADVLAAFEGAQPIAGLAHGVRLTTQAPVEASEAFKQGLFEVQDAGSQAITLACRVQPGMAVVDLCAGAGGKTLALAMEMAGKGRIIAADTNRDRLQRLPQRAERAGLEDQIETRLLNPGREMDTLADLAGAADCVLVDAPCSGSGTWRRNPEARWRITPGRLEAVAATQAHVLDLGALLVRQGGSMVYAVCSLIEAEGAAQLDAFLARHEGWHAASPDLPLGRAHGAGWWLTPGQDGSDGFFIAHLIRSC